MSIINFLNKILYCISLILYIVGLLLKQIPKIPNWSIPYILGLLGIIACNLITSISIESTVQGIIVTGLAVYAHQISKGGMIFLNSSVKNIDEK